MKLNENEIAEVKKQMKDCKLRYKFSNPLTLDEIVKILEILNVKPAQMQLWGDGISMTLDIGNRKDVYIIKYNLTFGYGIAVFDRSNQTHLFDTHADNFNDLEQEAKLF